jgi:hypothetical protein
MVTEDCRRSHGLRTLQRNLALTVTAAVAVVLWSGLFSPVRAADDAAGTLRDRAVLAEIAQDVLTSAAASPGETLPVETQPGPGAADEAVAATEVAPAPALTDMTPAREGTTVRIPRAAAAAKTDAVAPTATAADYQSNSWRHRPQTERALSFSSGVLAPASGLDPTLRARAAGLRTQGQQVMYGFVLLRGPADEALEKKLARLGVKLLGRHDDHDKARIPVASLDALVALPEVEWVGTSPAELKASAELADLRDPGARNALDAMTPIPIVINLFEGDDDGSFRRALEAAGVAVGEYDASLQFYRAVATGPVIDKITALDFVLFVEPIAVTSGSNDQSTPLVDADILRPSTISYGHTRYSGAATIVGILDSGFMAGGNPTPDGAVGHSDLNKRMCGRNFTTDTAGVYNDQAGHGTHVLGTIAGTGTANPRYRGVAPGVGTVEQIRAAKIWKSNNRGDMAWMEQAMDFMATFGECSSAPPEVINISGGAFGVGLTGTDSASRKLDDKTWTRGQLYVVSAGNDGPGNQTIGTPAVAKNALTVGNVLADGYLAVGDIATSSSRGPTGDFRMKPNLVAPGTAVKSAEAGTTSSYAEKSGTSMAAPHVTGIAATLMDHDYQFKGRPALTRAHLMATSLAHDGVLDDTNVFGLGRVSGYVAHWDITNSDGWSKYRYWGGVNTNGFAYGDITVPAGTKKLVVVMTWDEPAASAGASRAVTYNVDLWLDHQIDCADPSGRCGEYASTSTVDNVEYVVVENPPAGSYRMKVTPVDAPAFQLPWGMTAVIIRGDPTPTMNAVVNAPANPVVGTEFDVTMSLVTSGYVASGVQVQPLPLPAGVTLLGSKTARLDGFTHSFYDAITLGNLTPMLGRSATWKFRADTRGPKTFQIRAWSENAGEVTMTKTVQVVNPPANLVPMAVSTNPPGPSKPPGSGFAVTSTVQNTGTVEAAASKTRYYLSLDGVKGAGDVLLTGTQSLTTLAAGASRTATTTVTIPASTALQTYFLLVCADDLGAVDETDEADNCAAAGAMVTVGQPDLIESAISNPPATKVRGTSFSVTDTVQNIGAVASEPSKTRYYLSLDAVRSSSDKVLTSTRAVPALAAGVGKARTASVRIPATTTPGSYFVLACADDGGTVAETNETNNCVASATTLTVTP